MVSTVDYQNTLNNIIISMITPTQSAQLLNTVMCVDEPYNTMYLSSTTQQPLESSLLSGVKALHQRSR